MTPETDVLVIGAGPAGSVAAAKIRQAGYNVRVVEREKFPRFVIGESLLPRCMEVLDDCGLLEAVRQRGFLEKFGAKFVRGSEVSDFNFSAQFSGGWTWTWQVPRAEFDQALADEVARQGVQVDFETTVTGIRFEEDESSVTTVVHANGDSEEIHARFVVDASGYGRVIPRLFGLDKGSTLQPRKAVFAHLTDPLRHNYDEPNRIIIVSYAPGVWAWIIPFSSGNTSLGFVGDIGYFSAIAEDPTTQFEHLIANHSMLQERFGGSERIFEPRKLEAWSASSNQFYGPGYVLTGNATEFLDPVFSSGVMFATVSSHLAAQMTVRKLQGETFDWHKDYGDVVQQGVDTFKSYVMAWYDGTLEKIFYAKDPDPVIKQQICSVLAGYVWDQENPFVRDHKKILHKLAHLIEVQSGAGA